MAFEDVAYRICPYTYQLITVCANRRYSTLAFIGFLRGAMNRVFCMPIRRRGGACRKAAVYHVPTRFLSRGERGCRCLKPGTRLAARRAFARMESAMFNPIQAVIAAFAQPLPKHHYQ